MHPNRSSKRVKQLYVIENTEIKGRHKIKCYIISSFEIAFFKIEVCLYVFWNILTYVRHVQGVAIVLKTKAEFSRHQLPLNGKKRLITKDVRDLKK